MSTSCRFSRVGRLLVFSVRCFNLCFLHANKRVFDASLFVFFLLQKLLEKIVVYIIIIKQRKSSYGRVVGSLAMIFC
jgi:hypothetical protein